MNLISTLSLEELCEMYNNAWILKLAKQRNPYLFMWHIDDIEVDMEILFEAMEKKIPVSHRWDIEQIKQGLTQPTHHIAPGQHYQHLSTMRMAKSSLVLQIVDEEDIGLWRCRLYTKGVYRNAVLVKTNTILKLYQLITRP